MHSETAAQSEPNGVPEESIRAELQKILASPGFANSERLSRFLRYAVEETMAGQGDKLKESLIGTEVFGRKPTYDPRTDAVVRIEAVKLRARLKDYYASAGQEDEVIIDVPKGAYVAAFRAREVEAPPPPPPPAVIAEAPTPVPVARDQGLPKRHLVVAALIIVVIAVAVYFAGRRKVMGNASRVAELSSVAVLPFADLSPQRDQEYFCDGMTDEIIDALTKLSGLRVVARTSSFAFRGKQQDVREIGRKLNVGAVLEGSVRKSGDKLRITAQLVSVADGYHLWSETYEAEGKDVFAVQDEISRAIVGVLQVKLARAPSKAAAVPEDFETYDLYLKGRYHWGRWRAEGAEKAIQFFEQAIARDPKYAAAWSGLADAYCWMGFFAAKAPNEAMPKAKAAAEKAIALDDSLAAAHTSLGFVKALYDWDWPAAEHEFTRAIELNPGSAEAHFGYGITYLAPMNRVSECLREMKLARELDPLSLPTITYLGIAYGLAGQPQIAIEQYKTAIDLDPDFAEAHLNLALAYVRQNPTAAFKELQAARNTTPESRLDLTYAQVYAELGKRAEALKIVSKWEQLAGVVYFRPLSVATVYSFLGDKEKTLYWLDRAYTERDGLLAYLGAGNPFSLVRTDPRFIQLYKRLGLPQ
ncbi:MAG TPA: tetratricopeptide repeat protein [Bryobacteraceae bacterium]|nr:tetratricopeptide repeat protein [Bryobacteraceae bacterium]